VLQGTAKSLLIPERLVKVWRIQSKEAPNRELVQWKLLHVQKETLLTVQEAVEEESQALSHLNAIT